MVALTALLGVFSVGTSTALAVTAPQGGTPNPIQAENQLPGTTNWQIGGLPSQAIQGYATQMNLQAGQTLQLHVSTIPAAQYRVEIYRLGYYQGLGGRLIMCDPSCGGSKQGTDYAVNATTGYLGAGWPVTDSMTVQSSWVTGYYEAKLVLASGPNSGQASFVPFFVLAPPGEDTPVLVQASVNTWEAYNDWGGKSLYSFNSSGGVAATHVSFERPFNYPGASSGNPGPFSWEYSLVRWLEKNGYNVSYQTDIDTDENPGSLLVHKLVVINGHDEYMSHSERLAWAQAVSNGVNLAAIGGNIAVWQARYDSTHTSLYEYRSASADPNPDPSQKTTHFYELGLPECQLLGIGFSDGAKGKDPPSYGYSVMNAALTNPWFLGTGLTPGAQIFDSIGYEWDTIQPGCNVPPVTDLLHFSGAANGPVGGDGGSARVPADAVTYTAPSGARVFSSGSLQLVWALDDTLHSNPPRADPRVQALFTNIFNSLDGQSTAAGSSSTSAVRNVPLALQLGVRRVRGKLRLAVALSQPAALIITVSKWVAGRSMHNHCRVGATRGRSCWAWARRLTRHRQQLAAGMNRLRLRMRSLPPGDYLVTVTALGPSGASLSRLVRVAILHRF